MAARRKILRFLPEYGGLKQADRPRKFHAHAIPHAKLAQYMAANPGAKPSDAQMAWQEGQLRAKLSGLLRTKDRAARRRGVR